jgi:hypothetical protein
MKDVVVFFVVLSFWVMPLSAGNEDVLGEWDCEAVVDMTYPFILSFAEKEGKLAGSIIGDNGTTQLESVSYSDGTLKFQFDYPPAGGLIDFESKVKGKSIEGTLSNYMFMGDFSCTSKKE